MKYKTISSVTFFCSQALCKKELYLCARACACSLGLKSRAMKVVVVMVSLALYGECTLRMDKKTPDIYDWVGTSICLVGVSVMLFVPRQ